jgi:hypothetical protein
MNAEAAQPSPLVRTARQHALVIGSAAALYLAGAAGMVYVAGFGHVRERVEHVVWWWLPAAVGMVVIGFLGYCVAYRGIVRTEGGPRMSAREVLAVGVTGFGGLLAHGSGRFDQHAMRTRGAGRREAKVRTIALAGFEHGVLAAIVCPAAIVALILGEVIPRTDFTWPWALAPVPGFLLAAVLSDRYRDRLRHRTGLARPTGVALDAIHIALEPFRHPLRNELAVLGMAIYWAADMGALWMATAAFGVQMKVLSVIVVFGVGMIATRRTAPLGGAGVLLVALVPSVWYGAAVPFAAATMGVIAYRFLTLWLPLPGALLALPVIRGLRGPADAQPQVAAEALAQSDR